MGADPAPLAEVQVRIKISVFLFGNAPLGAVYVADAALDAFLIFPERALRPPASGMIFRGASLPENHASGVDFLPGFWPFLFSHRHTSKVISFRLN
jgi:hypothetical protein